MFWPGGLNPKSSISLGVRYLHLTHCVMDPTSVPAKWHPNPSNVRDDRQTDRWTTLRRNV